LNGFSSNTPLNTDTSQPPEHQTVKNMKKVFKFLGYAVLLILLIAAGALIYIKAALPNVGVAEEIKIDYTPERVERGRYLANHVTVCMDCHSTRDWSKFSGPVSSGKLGGGGERFDQAQGFPGIFYSKNITPTGISRYSDGELFRLITTGVTKEGRAMFPVMPYKAYGRMDPEDIRSLISYLRSLEPLETTPPESVADFPMNFIINTIPSKADLQTMPPKSDKKAYGKYLVNAAACIECHTPVDKGKIMEEFAFSGGREFQGPDGSVLRSSNITPHPKTGIGSWTEDMFIKRFKAYADSGYQPPAVAPGEFNTIMPWTMYAHMTNEDLSAIHAYLSSVASIDKAVTKFNPAPAAKK